MPQKDWLVSDEEEMKVEKGEKGEKLNFYAPDKIMTFEDLVWLAIQRNPNLSAGMVDIEIQEIRKRDAKWHYLPQLILNYTISNNITRYNEGNSRVGPDYGQPAYVINFSGNYNNPIETFFSVKAADELLQVAIVTQRMAIGDVINQIAQILLDIDYTEETIAELANSVNSMEKKSEALKIQQNYESNVLNQASLTEDVAGELELELKEKKMELVDLRADLKNLVGLDTKQALKIDAKSIYPLMKKYDPEKMDWKSVWRKSENYFLLGQQSKLEKANVLLAWSRYLPTVSFLINESPPKGQYQPSNGKTDRFGHLYLRFPILDWGERLRAAETADARGRKKFIETIARERDFGLLWEQNERKLKVAEARLERSRLSSENAGVRLENIQTAFNYGKVPYPLLADSQRLLADKRMAEVTALYNLEKTRLDWLTQGSMLTRHFLGQAAFEKDSQ